jgi:hypothetical protein
MAPTRTSTTRVLAAFLRHPDDTSTDTSTDTDTDTTGDSSDDSLGAGGQAALAAERKARKEAERIAKAHEAELAKARAEADELRTKAMSDDEKKIAAAVEAARDEVRKEIEAETAVKVADADRRVLASRVLTAATGKLTNPADAQAFINVDDLERDAQGNVTDTALGGAVEALIKERPYLAAKAGGGSADQGHRRDAKPDFSNRDELAKELAKLGLKPRS